MSGITMYTLSGVVETAVSIVCSVVPQRDRLDIGVETIDITDEIDLLGTLIGEFTKLGFYIYDQEAGVTVLVRGMVVLTLFKDKGVDRNINIKCMGRYYTDPTDCDLFRVTCQL